jgi:hypothetical protein
MMLHSSLERSVKKQFMPMPHPMPATAEETPAEIPRPDRVVVGDGVILDARHALVHPGAGWMAVADVHFGYEARRRRAGALLPDWGMPQCERVLHELVQDHQPARLIGKTHPGG